MSNSVLSAQNNYTLTNLQFKDIPKTKKSNVPNTVTLCNIKDNGKNIELLFPKNSCKIISIKDIEQNGIKTGKTRVMFDLSNRNQDVDNFVKAIDTIDQGAHDFIMTKLTENDSKPNRRDAIFRPNKDDNTRLFSTNIMKSNDGKRSTTFTIEMPEERKPYTNQDLTELIQSDVVVANAFVGVLYYIVTEKDQKKKIDDKMVTVKNKCINYGITYNIKSVLFRKDPLDFEDDSDNRMVNLENLKISDANSSDSHDYPDCTDVIDCPDSPESPSHYDNSLTLDEKKIST